MNRLLLLASFLVFGGACAPDAPPVERPEPTTGPTEVFEPYRARPDDLPVWARQGNFHFVRLDGGGIESMKAARTHWGKAFSEQQYQVLRHVYDRYSDKILDRLQEAGFNWVWITWSNGWSQEVESEQWQVLRPFIAKAHERGIKVSAYLSANNMFWESMFRDEPRSLTWVMYEDGLPVNYGGRRNKMRFLADSTNPEWRAYVVGKAEKAIAAGVDALFFDNVKGDIPENKMLFTEMQVMAARMATQTGRPKALLYLNAHLDPRKMVLNDICELIHNEYGKTTPGVWDDVGWNVSNVRKTRFLQGSKHPWQSHKYELDVYRCGPREMCVPPPVEQKLSIAEAWAFGAAFSKNLEGAFLEAIILDHPEGVAAWQAIAGYNRWITANAGLYTDVEPVADVAVVAEKDGRGPDDSPTFLLMDALLRESVLFDVKVHERFERGRALDRFSAVIIAEPVTELSGEEMASLQKFADGGGTIIAPPGEIARFSWKGARPLPPGSTPGATSGQRPETLVQLLAEISGGRHVKVVGAEHVLANVMRKRDGSAAFIHLLNYHHDPARNEFSVEFEPARIVGDGRTGAVRVEFLSPDGDRTVSLSPRVAGTKVSVTVDSLVHYGVLRVTSTR